MEQELFEPTLSSSYRGAHCVPSLVYDSDLAFRAAPFLPASRRHIALAPQGLCPTTPRQRCRALYRPSKTSANLRAASASDSCGEISSVHSTRKKQSWRSVTQHANASDEEVAAGHPAHDEGHMLHDHGTSSAFSPPVPLSDPADPYRHRGGAEDHGPNGKSSLAPVCLEYAKRAAAPSSTHRFYVVKESQRAHTTDFASAPTTSETTKEKGAMSSWQQYPTSSHGARGSYNASFIPAYRIRHSVRCHDGCINSIHTDPSGRFLLTGSDDVCVCLYRTDTWSQVLKCTTEHRANIFSAVFVPYQDQEKILTCGLDGQTLLLDVPSQHTTHMAAFSTMASSIVFPSATPTTAFVAYGDGHVVRVDTRCSPASSATGSANGSITANLSFGNPAAGFVSHVHALATHPRHPYTIASATDSSFVFFHDIRVGSSRAYAAMGLGRLRGSAPHDVDDGIGGLSFSQRGDWLAVNYRGDDVYLLPWEHELHGGALRPHTYYGHEEDEDTYTTHGVHDGAWPAPTAAVTRHHSSGKYVLAMEGAGARTVPLVLSRHYVALRGRRNSHTMFKEVAWMEEDAVVATGSDDGLVYFWSTESGKLLHRTRGDGDIVNGVLHHPGSGALITCGIDSSFKVLMPEADAVVPAQDTTASWSLVRHATRPNPQTAVHTREQLASPAASASATPPPAEAAVAAATTPSSVATRRESSGGNVPDSAAPFSATQLFANLIIPYLSPLVGGDSPSEAGSPLGMVGAAITPPSTGSPSPSPQSGPTPSSTAHVRWPSSTGTPSTPVPAAHAEFVHQLPTATLPETHPTEAEHTHSAAPLMRDSARPGPGASHRAASEEGSWSTLESDSVFSSSDHNDTASDASSSPLPTTSTTLSASSSSALTGAPQPPSNPFLVPRSRAHSGAADAEGEGETGRIPVLHAPAVEQLRQRVLEKVCELQSSTIRTVTANTTTFQLREIMARLQRCSADAAVFQSSLMDWEWDDDEQDLEEEEEEEEEESEGEEARALDMALTHGGSRGDSPWPHSEANLPETDDSESDVWEDVRNASSDSRRGHEGTASSSSASSASSLPSSGDWNGLLAPVEMLMGLGESVSRDRGARQTNFFPFGDATRTATHSGPRSAPLTEAQREAETAAAERRESRARAGDVLASSTHLHKVLVHLMCHWHAYEPSERAKRRVQYCVWNRSQTDLGNENYLSLAQPATTTNFRDAANEEAAAAPAATRPSTVAASFQRVLADLHDAADTAITSALSGQLSEVAAPAPTTGPIVLSTATDTASSPSSLSSSWYWASRGAAAPTLSDSASPASLLQDAQLVTAEFGICAAKILCLLQLETLYLQGKESLFYTPALRRQYWTRSASLHLQWTYYYMAIGDLNGVRRHVDELDSWWEYASIVALGSASPQFLAAHAQSLRHGGVIEGEETEADKDDGEARVAQSGGSSPSRKRSRRADDGQEDDADDNAAQHGVSRRRRLLVNTQSWRLVPAIHGDNAAQSDAKLDKVSTNEDGDDGAEGMTTAASSTWLPKLLVPLALRYRAVSQRLEHPDVTRAENPRLSLAQCEAQREELMDERRLVREELERRLEHHPHRKMVKKVRTMFTECEPSPHNQ